MISFLNADENGKISSLFFAFHGLQLAKACNNLQALTIIGEMSHAEVNIFQRKNKKREDRSLEHLTCEVC